MSHFDHASLEAPDVNGLDDLREQAIGKQDEWQIQKVELPAMVAA